MGEAVKPVPFPETIAARLAELRASLLAQLEPQAAPYLNGARDGLGLGPDWRADVAAGVWRPPVAVTVEARGPGTVTRNPERTAYPYLSGLMLRAEPERGARFVGWEGDLRGAVSAVKLQVRENPSTVVAVFQAIPKPKRPKAKAPKRKAKT